MFKSCETTFLKHLFHAPSTLFIARVVTLVAAVFLAAASASAVDVTLRWTPNDEENIAGYRVYSRQEGQSYEYVNPFWEGAQTSCTVEDLPGDQSFYFVARAYNTSGVESYDSIEVVCEGYPLMVSASSDRSDALPLEGQTLAGTVYIFMDPEEAVDQVSFFLDDPWMSGTPLRVERAAPYDLKGTNDNGAAMPFKTSTLTAGSHEITALVTSPQGDRVISAVFTVAAEPPLMVSTYRNRSNPRILEGRTLTGVVYIFVEPKGVVTRVKFYLDDPWMSKAPLHIETAAPYDLTGTLDNWTAAPFDTSKLAQGTHEITTLIVSPNGNRVTGATFTVTR